MENVINKKLAGHIMTSIDSIYTAEEAFSAEYNKIDSVRQQTLKGVMHKLQTQMAACKLGRDEAGYKIFRDTWAYATKENPQVAAMIASGVYATATFSAYRTGLFLAYVHNVDWTPSLAKSEEQGGLSRPSWWKKGNGKGKTPKGGKPAGKSSTKDSVDPKAIVPSAVEARNLPLLQQEAVGFASRCEAILGDKASQILAALKAAGLI